MRSSRRTVRTTQQFFEDLDRQLHAERGPHGEPSAHDFQVYELLRVVEQFATEFDSMSELIPGRPSIGSSSPSDYLFRALPSSVSSLQTVLSS